jgi:penicillin G amidase
MAYGSGKANVNVARLVFRLLLGRRLPVTSGSLTVAGIRAPIRVERDRWGVPSITAAGAEDAWFGLGFCQGQDRTFQLEAMLRVIRGTLSELIGPDGLPVDRFSRRIGFRRAALEQAKALDERGRRQMGAFAAGITAGAATGLRRVPHEFRLLGAVPTPWALEDAVGVLSLQSFSLASNWDSEMARLRVLTADGPEALKALDPTYAEWQGVASPPGTAAGPAIDRLAGEMSAFLELVGQGASNNWAVNARRTRAGRPLLANDPHLPPTLPPHWYLARLATPEWTVAGASFAGAPAFPAAHNGYAAWGVTVGLVDNTDLYLEEVSPDGRSVRGASGWEACQVVEEEISVKGAPSERLSVLVTPRGPVIGPALEGETAAISIQAIWLQPKPLVGLLDVHRSRSFEQFHKAWQHWPAVSLNMVYADAGDTIGWQLTGTAPVRRSGFGVLPQPAWDPAAGWTGEEVPFEDMPCAQNPKLGLIVTANANPSAAPEPFLGVDWIEGYRQDRIVALLRGRSDWDIEGFRAVQADVASTPWKEMREVLLAVPVEGAAGRGVELLSAWDGRVAADSAAASVFELWQAEMVCRVCRAKAPKSWDWAAGKGFTVLSPHSIFSLRRTGHLVRLLREKPAGWFDRGWEAEVADALGAAVGVLEAKHGTAPEGWPWGKVRPVTLTHPLGARKPLDRVFNLGPFPWGGDQNTVAQCAVDPLEPTGNPAYIQSMRMTVDLGKFEDSRWILPGGQSGNPLSPHYDDQLPLWLRGEGIPIAHTEAEVAAARVAALELRPPGTPTANRPA